MIDEQSGVWVCTDEDCNTDAPKQFLSFKTYMGSDLVEENAQFKNQALGHLDKMKKSSSTDEGIQSMDDLYHLLYSAPANLRYGDGSQNMGIRERLDPMGDGNQRMTEKEKGLASKTEPASVSEGTCSKCSGGCSNAWRSSSASSDKTNYYVCKA